MKSYVLISNGGGGIATSQHYCIKNVLKLKKKIFLIDKKKNHTEKYFKKKEKKDIISFYCNPIFQPTSVINYLSLIKKDVKNKGEIIFIFNNPLLLILYFLFIKIKFDNPKIYLFIHSHILKLNFSQILINLLSSIISPFIKKVYFVSKFTKSWWLKYFFFYRFSNYEICHNSIKIPNFSKLKTKGNRIGFVGRFEKEKGIDVFIEFSKYMRNSEFKFYTYGNGSFKNEIIKSQNIKNSDWEFKKKIYKKIDILLLTSPIENCPFTVLEAKSFGIPTLSISRGGVKEIIKNKNDGIILKENSNFNIIKNNLKFIKKNISRFSKNCIKNRSNFNYSINFLKILKKM